MPDRALRPRRGSSAKAVLLTVLGELVLPHGGAVWTATVVRGLGLLGIGAANARQALARLAEAGLVVSRREGRRARWHLTEEGRRLLTAGTERIYRFGAGAHDWDGRWLVVLSTVPEDQRPQRHQLRSRLAFAGFGFLGPGVALSPHLEREPLATAVLSELGLRDAAVVLRAEAGELVPADELLRRAWDLEELAEAYRGFLATFESAEAEGEEACVAALVALVHEWRRFPFIDPEIPDRLLPPGWAGRRAKALFEARHSAWSPAAHRWYEAAERAEG